MNIVSLYVYTFSLFFCLIYNFKLSVDNYYKDIHSKQTEQFYYPTDTYWDILGRIFNTFCPIVNTYVMLYILTINYFPKLLEILDSPLVPKNEPVPPANYTTE